MLKNNQLAEIAELIKKETHFLIAAHKKPDGDAIGSSVALAHLLKQLNKQVIIYNTSPLPQQFAWLKLPCVWRETLPCKNTFPAKVCILVDCGDINRIGSKLKEAIDNNIFDYTINIDHHLDNTNFCKINWVEPKAAATSMLIAKLALHLNIHLQSNLAEAIYVALVSDTGFFSYANTDSNVFELAHSLVKQGLNPGKVSSLLENQWSLKQIQLWGNLFQDIHLTNDGKIAYIFISNSLLNKYGFANTEMGDFSSWLRKIKGTLVCVSLKEIEQNKCKLSFRSIDYLDVQKIAKELGGGGHKNASGVELSLTPEKALELVLPKLEKLISETQISS